MIAQELNVTRSRSTIFGRMIRILVGFLGSKEKCQQCFPVCFGAETIKYMQLKPAFHNVQQREHQKVESRSG